jgi:hypothetical protein
MVPGGRRCAYRGDRAASAGIGGTDITGGLTAGATGTSGLRQPLHHRDDSARTGTGPNGKFIHQSPAAGNTGPGRRAGEHAIHVADSDSGVLDGDLESATAGHRFPEDTDLPQTACMLYHVSGDLRNRCSDLSQSRRGEAQARTFFADYHATQKDVLNPSYGQFREFYFLVSSGCPHGLFRRHQHADARSRTWFAFNLHFSAV